MRSDGSTCSKHIGHKIYPSKSIPVCGFHKFPYKYKGGGGWLPTSLSDAGFFLYVSRETYSLSLSDKFNFKVS